MKIHRFFINKEIKEGDFVLSDKSLTHQILNVFRFGKGDRFNIFNGDGFEYEAIILEISNKNEILIDVKNKHEGVVPKRKITLYQSLIKKDNMEWVIQKATELGVSKIIPIISSRSEKKGFNMERANKISIEASEQSGRADIVEIREIIDLKDIVLPMSTKIVFDISGTKMKKVSFDDDLPVSIFIGPEGGWSKEEIDYFKDNNFTIASLGETMLRAETAAIVATSLVILK